MVRPGVAARLAGALLVFLAPVAGQGDDPHGVAPRLFPQPAGHLVAVHPRQADVEQDEAGESAVGRPEGGRPVVDGADFVSQQRQQEGEAVGRVVIVVHDEDAVRRPNGELLCRYQPPARGGGCSDRRRWRPRFCLVVEAGGEDRVAKVAR